MGKDKKSTINKNSAILSAGTIEMKSRKAKKDLAISTSTIMKDKMVVRQNRFPWVSYEKSDMGDNYAWCKICDMSVYMPSSRSGAEHQRTSQHIRLHIERTRNFGHLHRPSVDNTEAVSAVVATAAPSESNKKGRKRRRNGGKPKRRAAMAELQSKYNWLDPDANDKKICICRICGLRLPIKVFYLRQHDASRKHAEGLERQISKEAAPSVSTNSEATEADAEVQESDWDKDSDVDMSMRSDSSTAEPPEKRSRRPMEVPRIVCAVCDSKGKRHEERSQLDMAKDMICSSFDIVSRLRTMEREGAMGHGICPAQAPEPVKAAPTNAQPAEPRHVMDYLLCCIAPTMKSLPADLAAEGKAKIMQLVCGLELKAIQRNSAASLTSTPAPPTSVAAAPAPATSEPSSAIVQTGAANTNTTGNENQSSDEFSEANSSSSSSTNTREQREDDSD